MQTVGAEAGAAAVGSCARAQAAASALAGRTAAPGGWPGV